MKRWLFTFGIVAALAIVLILTVRPALAHEHRTIADKYDVVVGWDVEPALVNQRNAAGITVYKVGTQAPVEGLEKTLKVMIAYGGNEPKAFELVASDETPGHYTANIIPSRVGDYVFTFTGTIEETPVNENFESGPGRFDSIDDTADLIFPAVTAASDTSVSRDEFNSLRTLAIAGLVVGVIGALIGLAALMTRARQ
jgi:hypothetical protein